MNDNNEVQKLLQYWYLVGFFDQPDFPYESKENKENNHRYLNAKKEDYKPASLLRYNLLKEPVNLQSILIRSMKQSAFYTEISDEIHICVGKIDRDICVRELFKITGNKEEAVNAITGSMAVFGLKINNTSAYAYNSFNLSPVIWAIHKISNNPSTKLHELLTYEQYRDDMKGYENILKNKGIISSDIIKELIEHIEKKYIKYLSNKNSHIDTSMALIYQLFINEESKESNEGSLNYSDLCQNFYSQDIKLLEENICHIPYTLKKYILGLGRQNQSNELIKERLELCGDEIKDKEKMKKFYYKWLDIKNSPLGKWPSKFSPSLMQQIAINLAISNQTEINHAISVNGPPGTGKTTLLKEVISHNIVSRAAKLVEYANPNDAFKEKKFKYGPRMNGSYDQKAESFYTFKDESLGDYGMLITSSNNAAVENITKELPSQSNIKASLTCNIDDQNYDSLKEINSLFNLEESINSEIYSSKKDGKVKETIKKDIYFSYYANSLLGKKDKEDEWGLVSAPLGNAKNNSEYYRKVLSGLYYNFLTTNKIENRKNRYVEICQSFKNQLDIVMELRDSLSSYSQSYLKMMDNIDRMKCKVHKCEVAIVDKDDKINQSCQSIKCLVVDINKIRHSSKKVHNQCDFAQIEYNQENEKMLNHSHLINNKNKEILELEDKLGIFDWLYQLINKPSHRSEMITDRKKELEEIKKENSLLVDNCNNLLKNYERAQEELNINYAKQEKIKEGIKNNTKEIKKYYLDIRQYKSNIVDLNNSILEEEKKYRNIISEAKDKGIKVLDDKFWTSFFNDIKDNADNIEVSIINPWITRKYDRAREKLLYLAFQVHKEFILSSSCCMNNIRNFLLMNKVIKGNNTYLNYDERDKSRAYASLFNTILLFTPVVSTTFASVGKLLGYIKKPKQIGMLIIDEAGQAQPHMALGAMYRSKKVLVVGDPKQIEPVVKSEVQAIKLIVGSDINSGYLEKTLSVQELADITNPYGRYFNSVNDYKTWVGCPLNVHRRCISPMYDISNTISYNNSMKKMTIPLTSKKEGELFLKTSYWLNVSGNANNAAKKDYYVKEQGTKVFEIIKGTFLNIKKDEIPNIYVISPFVSVIMGVKKLIKAENKKNKFCEDKILDDWMKSNCGTIHTFQGKEANEVLFVLGCDVNCIGAIRWVNANIINVAVTRAKYRLCIIGNYQVWKKNDLMRQTKLIIEKFNLNQLYDLREATINNQNKELSQFLSNILFSKNVTDEEEIDSISTEDIVDAIRSMKMGSTSLSSDELKRFNLSEKLLDKIDKNSKRNLIYGIHVYNLLITIQTRYEIENIDYSSCSILWCKAMEGHIRDNFYNPLRIIALDLFETPEIKFLKTLFTKKKMENIMLGNYINMLNKIEVKIKIVDILTLKDKNKNQLWYNNFCSELNDFRNLRNDSCHPTIFDINRLHKLINVLFINEIFKKVCIGKLL